MVFANSPLATLRLTSTSALSEALSRMIRMIRSARTVVSEAGSLALRYDAMQGAGVLRKHHRRLVNLGPQAPRLRGSFQQKGLSMFLPSRE